MLAATEPESRKMRRFVNDLKNRSRQIIGRPSRTQMSSTIASQQCRLFALPPEIRNYIFQLSFTTDLSVVDLFKTSPPSNGLMMTSRQAYREARGFYRTKYREYWSTTRFTITIERDQPSRNYAIINYLRGKMSGNRIKRSEFATELRDQDVAHISNISLVCTFVSANHCSSRTLRLVYQDGLWWTLRKHTDKQWFGGYMIFPADRADAIAQLAMITQTIGIVPSRYIPPHRLVATRSSMNSGEPIRQILDDAQIDQVKRAAGKIGLTKQEIIAALEIGSKGVIST